VEVTSAAQRGVYLYQVGSPSAIYPSSDKNGFEVDGAQGQGLYVGRADLSGVAVASAGYSGVYVGSAGVDGIHVGVAGESGLEVDSAECGVHVDSTATDGLHVESAGRDGLYVNSADYDGVAVYWANFDGVYANTGQDNHEWGFYTRDKTYAGSALAAGGPSMTVALNGDGLPLEPGDMVAVSGGRRPLCRERVPRTPGAASRRGPADRRRRLCPLCRRGQGRAGRGGRGGTDADQPALPQHRGSGRAG